MSFKLPAKFSEATADILVTVGEKEKSMMKKSALEIVNANDNCTGVIFSGVGHGAPLSASTLFNQQLDQWINDKNLIEKTLKV